MDRVDSPVMKGIGAEHTAEIIGYNEHGLVIGHARRERSAYWLSIGGNRPWKCRTPRACRKTLMVYGAMRIIEIYDVERADDPTLPQRTLAVLGDGPLTDDDVALRLWPQWTVDGWPTGQATACARRTLQALEKKSLVAWCDGRWELTGRDLA